MAIKHVVTLGFGFTGSAPFIPTLGFSIAVVEGVPVVILDYRCRYEPTLEYRCQADTVVDLRCQSEPTLDLRMRT